MASKNALAAVLFVVIILLGLLLRLHHLEQESLWTDEAYAVSYAQEETAADLVEKIAKTEGAPPGHYLLLHYWIKIFGSSEFSVRLPSLIFGVLSILLMFKIGVLLFDRKVGLLAALLMSTSMLQVLFSQEARLYSLYFFLVLSAAYFFIKTKDSQKLIHYFGYALTMILALYTNYLAGALIFLFTFIALWYKLPLKKILIANLFVSIAAIPLLPLIFTQFTSLNSGLTESLIKLGLPAFLAQFGVIFYALPLIGLLLFIFVLIIFKEKIKSFSSRLRPLFVPVLVIFSLAYLYLSFYPFSLFGMNITRYPITRSFFLIRHSYFLVPIFYLFVSSKLVYLKSKKLFSFCLLLILVVNSCALYTYYGSTTKAEWNEAGESIPAQSLVLLPEGGLLAPEFLADYYLSDPRVLKLTWFTERGTERQELKQERLFSILEKEKEFWMIVYRDSSISDYYKDMFDSHFKLKEEKDFYLIKGYHYIK